MTDLARWKLHGSVRTLHIDTAAWDAAQSTWQTPRSLSAVSFRADGQLAEGEVHHADGTVSHQLRSHDEGGRLIEEQSWIGDGPRVRKGYAYDAQGRLTAVREVDADGTSRQIETTVYDAAGRRTTDRILAGAPPPAERAWRVPPDPSADGSEAVDRAPGAVRVTIVHDGDGRPAEATFFDADQRQVRGVTFTRDDRGRIVHETVLLGDHAPVPEMLAGAEGLAGNDPERIAILMAAAFPDRMFASTSCTYDQKGRLRERTSRRGTLSEETTRFEYDDRDNPILELSEGHRRELHVAEDGTAHARNETRAGHHHLFTYRYDAQGNWIERVVWARTGLQVEFARASLDRRNIAYYDQS